MTAASDPYANYAERFEAEVYATLGGLDMARDFFRRHPSIRRLMASDARHHRRKGGYPASAAAVFFQQRLQPVIQADRIAAQSKPWK